MALSEGSLVQSPAVGWFSTQTGVASLGAPTTAGNGVLLVTFRCQDGSLPIVVGGFMEDTNVAAGGACIRAFHRNVDPGETGWTLDSQFPGDLVFWFLYELSLLDAITTTSQIATSSGVGVTTVSTGTTPTVPDDDIICLAVHATASAATTIGSQTNGFSTYHDDQSATSGSQHGAVAVSRLYPGAGGTFESTATFGTSVTALGAMLVYRAGAVIDVSLPVVLSSAPPGG